MEKIIEILRETGVFFMATVNDNKPALRPLGAFLEKDGKLIFGVGDFKEVYRQMKANPMVEIVACKKDGHWLRYSGKAVFETDESYAEQMIKENHLEAIYNDKTGNKLMTFHIEYASAVEIAIMGEGEKLI